MMLHDNEDAWIDALAAANDVPRAQAAEWVEVMGEEFRETAAGELIFYDATGQRRVIRAPHAVPA